jgi:alpha-L-rhamnosidase
VLAVAHDVTSHLSSGANAIGAILGTGWYDVHDEATWYFHKAPWRDRPRLRLLLAIDYSDGRSVLIPSDGTWKSTTGPILRDGIYTGEIYDARQELSGWNTATYDDSAWKPADMVSAPAGRIAFLKCPPVAITRTITPVAITQPKPGVFIVDMGENFAGHAQLTVQAPAGTTITMRYSERLDKTGMIERGKIDCYMTKTTPAQPFQTDTYICKGGGTETWEQRFSYHGFRYVEVTGFPGTPTVDHFRGRYAHTAFELSGSFTCSNDLINRIQAATVRAYHSNAQNIPTDCPQREKNGWTGDAQLACEAGLMNFRSATFYAKWLDDIADAQRADGGIAVIIPTSGWGDGKTWPGPINPPWDSAYHIIAWDVYRYTGDDRLLRRHFPGLKRYVDLVASHAKNGVTPGWVLGDWMPWSVTAPNELTSTTYLYHDARIVAAAAKALGKTDEATRYTALADGIRDGFNRRFLKNGRYANGTQCAQAMPLHYGLVPDVQRPAVFALLAADASKKGHIDAGILGAKYLLRVLAEGGRSDLVWRIASRTEQPGWGWWIKQGATTLWEDWKGTSSLNHIMFGDISNWFYQWLAGIGLDPEKPGFAHIRIQPQLVGDLTWVTAWHDSPRGRITSSWKKGADGFRLDLTIPANAQATVWMPAADATLVSEGGKPAAQAEGVKFLRQEGDRAVFAVGSGTYAFMTRMR